MESIAELAAKLKGDGGRWEEEIFHWACGLTQSIAKELLERVDEELMKEREEGLKVEGLREYWITTLFGDIKIRHRLYGDGEGNYRFLLDEAIGLRKRGQPSPKVLDSHPGFDQLKVDSNHLQSLADNQVRSFVSIRSMYFRHCMPLRLLTNKEGPFGLWG